MFKILQYCEPRFGHLSLTTKENDNMKNPDNIKIPVIGNRYLYLTRQICLTEPSIPPAGVLIRIT